MVPMSDSEVRWLAPVGRAIAAQVSGWVRDLTPGSCALVMATGIVAAGLRVVGWSTVATGLLCFAGCAFVVLVAATVWRLLRHRDRILGRRVGQRLQRTEQGLRAEHLLTGPGTVEPEFFGLRQEGVHTGRIEPTATVCGMDIANRMTWICSVAEFFAQPSPGLGDARVRFGQPSGQQLVDVWHAVRDMQGDLDAGLLGQRSEPLHAVPQRLVAATGQQQRWKASRIGI